jgi:hypothetical protein
VDIVGSLRKKTAKSRPRPAFKGENPIKKKEKQKKRH